MNKLIGHLIAVKHYAKGLHYAYYGDTFYGNHLLMDLVADEIDGFIDDIKEDIILARGYKPLNAKEYLAMAINLMPDINKEERYNTSLLKDLINKTVEHINGMNNLSKGDENLIGAIAQKLQKAQGLLNLYLEA